LVNLRDLAHFGAGEKITPELLLERGLVKKIGDGIKVLGTGELSAALTIAAHRFSKSALEKIRQAGGTAEVLRA
jgi:large subunit ribosomal protein L15